MILSTHLFCLLNLSTTPQLFPAFAFNLHILCIRPYTSVQPTKYYSLFTMRDLLCMIYYARFTMRDLLCMIYYALCTMHYALCTMHYYALCITMHYALCTMHLYVFMRIYYFIRIHTYLLFNMEIRRNPMILVLTRSSRRVE